jgi:outer membrane protein
MKNLIGLVAVAACAVGATWSPGASAEEGHWMARLRAVRIDTANKSDAFSALGIDFAKDAVEVSKKTIPDIDVEYFFGGGLPLSAELVLTYPQKHDVSLQVPAGPKLALGTFKHLPPTLTLKYNFIPNGTFRPYVGLGVNYTKIMDVNLAVPVNPAVPLDLDRNSFGIAGQVGFDVKVGDHWFANLDVKYVDIKADVKVKGGPTLSTVKVQPFLYGVGVGYRF